MVDDFCLDHSVGALRNLTDGGEGELDFSSGTESFRVGGFRAISDHRSRSDDTDDDGGRSGQPTTSHVGGRSAVSRWALATNSRSGVLDHPIRDIQLGEGA